ncbi:HAD family hydrolase [Thermosipho melanesiensis]|uniref:HAD-superfamily hydrolase, subfamily IIA n=2 Tax=Thermosipho melanesiensis TaxID=46541 RepID=A6LJ18_THEM4|nr:HAD-IIA family hydrolase [Thermosipho melanesiensis]ABR29919.1 HAD-superfamily hydrolase, subfamily IIA [Thermosipho melanesiensis BI429]APT73127.1 HAD family hydrolase [Thermosipho melanesiensis]OOC38525.1 HAD family hydrolase [Thermosipho melanesiensis]OOC40329.1 HAD family hydrolase [Thermosipho melanesiensis]OOC40593.1 HAD family hydrolase [Thermosipho melanesiensis]
MTIITDDALEKLKKVRLFVLDIDGTFSLSGKLLPGSISFAKKVKNANKKFVFLTNNSNKSIETYLKEFSNDKIKISASQIFTAGIETAEYLYEKFGPKKIYIVGNNEIKDIFKKAGHTIVENNPDIVVVTFDTTLNYEKLAKASIYVSKGKLFVLTNPDLNCPSEIGPIPDTGAIASIITKTTGKKPDIVFGKPDPLILEMIMKKHNVTKDETCVIGDRLYTDILLGKRAEVLTVLVLTGEAKKEDITNIKPDIIANDIGEISEHIR